jgi:hypothetical protein
VVLLLNTTDGLMDFVRKTVVSVTQVKKVFSGWFISVERAHLFLTKTTSTNNESFVSIEHNGPSCPVGCCSGGGTCPTCPKSEPYCSGPYGNPQCFSYQGICY